MVCSITALLSTDNASSVAVVMTTLLILTSMTMIMMMLLLQIFSVSADVDDITEDDDDLGDGGKEEAGLGRDSPGTGSGTQESGYGSTCTDSLGYRDFGDSADTEGGKCITFFQFDILVIAIVSICIINSCLTHNTLADLETCGDGVEDGTETQIQMQTQRHSHKMMVSSKSYSNCLYRLE